MLKQRRSGILLHPTSLPGPQPVGSFGRDAYQFIDWLVTAGQTVWQVLPLGPPGLGDCPYSCYSAFAGNPLLIDLEQLTDQGDLQRDDHPPPSEESATADFDRARKQQLPLLQRACNNFLETEASPRYGNFKRFCQEQAHWLDDYALFMSLRNHHQQQSWQNWPADLRLHRSDTLDEWRDSLHTEIEFQKYVQFVFCEQWLSLKEYANQRGILIFGDLPVFVAEDSADVWANQELFHLDDQGRPTLVAGVPPDYFSSTGQRWGNPLYHWERMEADNFSWWQDRFAWNFQLFDLLRVDHFRGFAACWAIPASDSTAENGRWVDVHGGRLFDLLKEKYREELPIIAEDLGVITPDVEELRDRFTFPGMKILHFAFDSDARNPYLPHNLIPNAVIYTGTHDNNTTLGWWQELETHQQRRIEDYLRRPAQDMPWPIIETAQASVPALAVIPLQDILSLPAASRMNRPGTANGNWSWRVLASSLTGQHVDRLQKLTHLYGRDLCFTTEMP